MASQFDVQNDALTPPPFWGRHHYSRGETIADGVVHLVGIVLAIAAGAILLSHAFLSVGPGEFAAAAVYVTTLVCVLSISCAYNIWPMTPAKWVLRRFDHAAIFLLIAGTYTPFLSQLPPELASRGIAQMWTAAAAGVVLKLFLPGRFDRTSIGFYMALGWGGAMIAAPVFAALPPATFGLLLAGGLIYSFGVVLYIWNSLLFHNALWHACVVIGAGLHFTAVLDCLVLTHR